MPAAPTRDPRLPYTEISDDFLPPRDPVLGYIKIGGKDSTIRYTRAGKPWVAPTRLLDPARFEVTTREKIGQKVKGAKGSSVAGQDFTVDLGYVRDAAFHALEDVGEKPNALRVRFLYPRWNQNLYSFLGAYGREWVCRGNGVEAIDIKRGACACPCPRLVQFSGKYKGTKPGDKLICKPHGQLNVMLEAAGVFGGFWPFKTTGFETISNLTKSLQIFEQMFKRVDGLPLELRVMAATKQIPGGGTTVQPIVTLVLPASQDTARQVAADAAAEARKFLPAGRPLDEEAYREAVVSEMESEAKSYAGEFLPLPEVEVETIEATEETTGPDEETIAPDDETIEPEKETVTLRAEERGVPESYYQDDRPEEEEGAPDDSDRNDPEVGSTQRERAERGRAAPTDPEPPLEEYDRDNYDLAMKVLEAADDWTPEGIKDRVEFHRKRGTLDKLLERLEKNLPEEWAKVAEAEEPEDGLGS
jgi:hypothetical protein